MSNRLNQFFDAHPSAWAPVGMLTAVSVVIGGNLLGEGLKELKANINGGEPLIRLHSEPSHISEIGRNLLAHEQAAGGFAFEPFAQPNNPR